MFGEEGDTTGRVLRALLAMQRQSWEQGLTGHALSTWATRPIWWCRCSPCSPTPPWSA
ncbi:hypothetical protein MRQ36_22400 [Micromonospora sp. R77]|uniref:hypothetical protein n=1 Tax=Micromonospora sp. R77 TaxID=2925836 RepID=UPI001F6258BA|nr:hypothetical protein [Micromonospora sp. R77]MCI4065168.1 hypothetical protein [Micromonospora sp. R77]